MKLAEALSLRKDLEKRISGLKERLENVARVQEDDAPAECPTDLLTELDRSMEQLEKLIYNINVTNMRVVDEEGNSMTKLLANRDVLNKRIGILRNTFNRVSSYGDRYCRTEIRTVATMDARQLHQELDKYAKQAREIDLKVQRLNFTYDLLE
jgi:hypothetical protein